MMSVIVMTTDTGARGPSRQFTGIFRLGLGLDTVSFSILKESSGVA